VTGAFRRLVAVKLISDAAGYLDWVAMSVYILSLRGSARDVGLFLALKTAGGFLGGLFAGGLRTPDRRRVMAAADGARGAALVLLALSPWRTSLPALAAVGALLGFCASVYNAALQAAVPAIVGEAGRPAANALVNTAACAAMVSGSLGAGALAARFGIVPIWLVDAATYFLSAGNVLLLDVRTSEARAKGVPRPGGWSWLESITPAVAVILAIRLADTLGSAGHNVALPVFGRQLLPDNPSLAFGAIVSAWALGKVAGGKGAAALDARGAAEDVLDSAFGAATVLMSAAFVALFYLNAYAPVLACAAVAGAADGLSEVFCVGRLQRLPDEARGGVFGALGAVQSLGLALGMLCCSPLFDRMRTASVVALLHSVPLALAAAFTISRAKRLLFKRDFVLDSPHELTALGDPGH
jgi:MFS family permease